MAAQQFSRMEGGPELAAVLRQLPDQLQKNALASTARAGALELRRFGLLHLTLAMQKRSAREDDVVIKARRSPKGETAAEYVVGPPRRKPWLRWLHDGTKPHLIGAGVKYGTRRGVRNVAYGVRNTVVLASRILDRFFGKQVSHPGQPPRPWLKAAQFAGANSVIRAMAEQVRKALPAQAKRLASSKFRSQQIRRLFR